MSDSNAVHFYNPDEGHKLRHDPFKAIVAPRVIGWISSCDPHGQFFRRVRFVPAHHRILERGAQGQHREY
jgi:hypothetical protein